jgi:mevalonate kinase
VTPEEMPVWVQVLREDIRGIHDRLDTLNGRTRSVEVKVAVLEDRAEQAAKTAIQMNGKATKATWGAGLGGAFVVALEVVKWWRS